jgi:N-acetylglucosamine-6-sulfatase
MGMLRAVKLLASVGLSVAVASCVLLLTWTPSAGPRKAQAATGRPNFVFVLTDDMRYDDLSYMPKTRSLLEGKGMAFDNALVSNPLCTPSRASILRGQYPHNTGVWTNKPTSPDGGEPAFRANGDDQDSLATRLQGAGYSTGLFGKYMNHYSDTYIPPGWDRWFTTYTFDYFDYKANDQGTVGRFGTASRDYATDVIKSKAVQFVSDSVARGEPFFAYVAPFAPHYPSTPAPRDEHDYDNTQAPRLPSFNEADVSDKPPWIQQLPELGQTKTASMDSRHEDRIETLQAVDDTVGKLVATLRNDGQLANTYIFFTSDNGEFYGEHRITNGKARPYEEAYRIPLLVRGPGVARGDRTAKMALNIDYAPTMLALAGEAQAPYFDGRPLTPLLDGTDPASWRIGSLIERRASNEGGGTPDSEGIRSENLSYVEYSTGEKELYDLSEDPYELTNEYDPDAPPTGMASRLKALKTCASDAVTPMVTCSVAEDGK